LNKTDEQYLVVLTGPTAIGKTEMAIKLSQKLDGLIISADSRQIYKEMSIGTAKPTPEQIQNGNITLVDHVSVKESYSAGTFEKEALAVIEQAFLDSKLPILCGGTGLYIRAVCEGFDDFPDIPDTYTQALRDEVEASDLELLLKEIKDADPEYFEKLDKNNLHRVSRVLSVIRFSGKPFSSFLNQAKKPRSFKPIYIVLEQPREVLYEKINQRVHSMIEKGLIDEARSLLPLKDLPALNTVGYSEVFSFLEGNIDQEKCISEIQKNSRRYAKRQLTWFRNQMKARAFKPGDFVGIKNYVKKYLE